MTEERIEQIREHLEAHHLHYLADECHELLSEVERLQGGLDESCRCCAFCGEDLDQHEIVARIYSHSFAFLKSEVDAILKAIVASPPKDRYCVNYADLRCVNVSRVIEEDGGQWWLVEMEEGDDHEFCELVRSKLSLGYEMAVCDVELGVGGTLDVLAETTDGELVLIDWKTSKSVYDKHLLQVAAYARMHEKMGLGKIARAYIVQMNKVTAALKVVPVFENRDEFLDVAKQWGYTVATYHWLKAAYKKLKKFEPSESDSPAVPRQAPIPPKVKVVDDDLFRFRGDPAPERYTAESVRVALNSCCCICGAAHGGPSTPYYPRPSPWFCAACEAAWWAPFSEKI